MILIDESEKKILIKQIDNDNGNNSNNNDDNDDDDDDDDDNKCHEIWSRKEKRKWFILLLSGTCLLYATRTSVPLLMPIISQEKKWNTTDSGIILSSFFWGYILTQFASGYISDRIGGLKIMWIAAIGWSSSTFFIPNIIDVLSTTTTTSSSSTTTTTTTITQQQQNSFVINIIALTRIINGAFQGMHFPSVISLTSKHVNESDRALFFGVLISGSALGTLLTGSLGSYLLSKYNWKIVFHVMGSLGFLWSTTLYYQTLDNKKNKKTNFINKNKIKTNNIKNLSWRKVWSKPSFLSCVFTHACQNNCFFVLLSWIPTYFHDVYPDVEGWMVNMVPWLSFVPCTFIGKSLTEKLINSGYSVTVTRKIIETICLTMQIVNLLILTQVETYYSAMLCLMFIIGGTGFHNTAIAIVPSDLAPSDSGSVFGLMNSIGAIPGFVGVYFAGHILHMTHSWPAVFVFIAIIDVLGWIVYLIFGSSKAII
ncbi:hypothetical protein HCN44_009029 [Aphidius gifuensis]|uniref:Major facilitator superfamily (MFS) profile domain-containing protein n=1 Tax=Aphidius gifuensis TaxID=684658 RepID=A0A834XNR3_APHGI|nr:solute carrier family 17 member 9-like [Aphidius gifuensis]KAF7990086.1 hypothetical protein HCN44_009029 [Aphidius gifuensis]